MKIKKILSQDRRDFTAIFVCETCGREETRQGYDDRNFHSNVIPRMECAGCGKIAPSSYQPIATKHADHEVV